MYILIHVLHIVHQFDYLLLIIQNRLCLIVTVLCVIVILEMSYRYFNPVNSSQRVNKHQTSQDLCLISTQHRVSEGLLLLQSRAGIDGTNFSEFEQKWARQYYPLNFTTNYLPCEIVKSSISQNYKNKFCDHPTQSSHSYSTQIVNAINSCVPVLLEFPCTIFFLFLLTEDHKIRTYFNRAVHKWPKHFDIPPPKIKNFLGGNFVTKEYEILRSPGSGASLLKMGQVYNYCAMRSICLLNRAISPTFLPLCPRHSRFHQMYFPPSSPQDKVDST